MGFWLSKVRVLSLTEDDWGPGLRFKHMPIRMAKVEAFFQLVNRFVKLEVKLGPYRLFFC
jgi:hypothetical protein